MVTATMSLEQRAKKLCPQLVGELITNLTDAFEKSGIKIRASLSRSKETSDEFGGVYTFFPFKIKEPKLFGKVLVEGSISYSGPGEDILLLVEVYTKEAHNIVHSKINAYLAKHNKEITKSEYKKRYS
jgi:hypothetical protein